MLLAAEEGSCFLSGYPVFAKCATMVDSIGVLLCKTQFKISRNTSFGIVEI